MITHDPAPTTRVVFGCVCLVVAYHSCRPGLGRTRGVSALDAEQKKWCCTPRACFFLLRHLILNKIVMLRACFVLLHISFVVMTPRAIVCSAGLLGLGSKSALLLRAQRCESPVLLESSAVRAQR